MKKTITVFALIIVLIAGVVVITISAIAIGSDQVSIESGGPAVTPTSTETVELKAVIQKYFHITGLAARTSDVSQLDTVVTNDPSIQLDEAQIAFLKRAGAIQQDVPADIGFLDFELANFGYRRVSAAQVTRLAATPKVAPYNRNLTVGAIRPINPQGLTPRPYRKDPMYEDHLTFNSFKISGSKAQVEFVDQGSETLRFFLTKTALGWKISGQRVLSVHF
jgi:hypothetical protein